MVLLAVGGSLLYRFLRKDNTPDAPLGAPPAPVIPNDPPTPAVPPGVKVLARFEDPGVVNALAFAPGGKVLASAAMRDIKLRDVSAKTELATLTGHHGLVSALAFSPDGKTLASGDQLKVLSLWDLKTQQPRKTFGPLLGGVRTLAFSDDGKTLGAGCMLYGGGECLLWDPATGREQGNLRVAKDAFASIAFAPDSKTLVSSGGTEGVHLYDVPTWKRRGTLEGSQGAWQVRFSPNGTTLATAENGTIKLWDPASGKELAAFPDRQGTVCSLSFSADGGTLASLIPFGDVKLWDVKNRKERASFKETKVTRLEYSPVGNILAVVVESTKIQLWDVSALTE